MLRPARNLPAALVLLGAVALAHAQGYPVKPIRIVVPFPPGGSTDIAARAIGQKMSESWGQSVIVENRPGAGGNIGSDIVAKSAPDGYSLIMGVTGSHAINISLFAKMPYDPVRDFEPISLVAVLPNVLVVHPSVPASSVAELVKLARSQPGKLSYGSTGTGTAAHLTMELFKSLTGADIVHVPYKGSAPMVTDILGGQISLIVDGLPSALPHIRGGRLKALGITSLKRSGAAPEIPTIAETVPGFGADAWSALFAPAGTPKPIVDKLAAETARILKLPDVRERLGKLGAEPVGSTPPELAAHLRSEIDKWAKVVKASGARVD